jgi:hypothetical protein
MLRRKRERGKRWEGKVRIRKCLGGVKLSERYLVGGTAQAR